ncbi:hypothetical protein HJC23_013030 [Cyclotella cryptica]|uniref:Uncharacterized protein n=1 Tax=Cyclotella cryptica TaxID=29204 RepID=A0ABD3QNL8_9STRA
MTCKRRTLSTALAAISLVTSSQAFQPASPIVVNSVKATHSRLIPLVFTSTSADRRLDTSYNHGSRSLSTISMLNSIQSQSDPAKHSLQSSLFANRKRIQSAFQKLRRSFAILLASLAIVFSTAQIHTPPAHASSVAIASKSSTSLLSKLNPLRPRSASELIDAYVRDRLFADDEFHPVESAYREAFADYPSTSSTEGGAYPTLLAETAASALGRKDGSSLVLSRSIHDPSQAGGKEGITGALIRASDFLQQRLKVSSSVSYYIIAAGLLVGGCVLPGTVGVAYQAFQRLQIDKSEMKMYGKITE